MTVNDARKIIAVMLVSYPNFKPIDTELMATTWADMLNEYSYEQVSVALKCYITTDTSGFAPSIGQLVDRVSTFDRPQELNELEAWSLVYKAIRNSGYNSEYEFSILPDVVRKTVGTPNQLRTWAMDENFNEQVVSSHFIKCYRSEVAKDREFRKMPANIRLLISNNSKAQIDKVEKQHCMNKDLIKESENKLAKCFENRVIVPDKLSELKDSLKYNK